MKKNIEHPHGIDLTDDDLDFMYGVWAKIGEEQRAKRDQQNEIQKAVKKAVKKALGK